MKRVIRSISGLIALNGGRVWVVDGGTYEKIGRVSMGMTLGRLV